MFTGGPGPPEADRGAVEPSLDHADVDLIGAGGASYLYRHWHPPFCFYFRCKTRSFALRARGLKTISSEVALIGRLVRLTASAS